MSESTTLLLVRAEPTATTTIQEALEGAGFRVTALTGPAQDVVRTANGEPLDRLLQVVSLRGNRHRDPTRRSEPGPSSTASASAEPAPNRLARLTAREQAVVQLLLSNGRVRSIAEQLRISPHTVRNHLRSIFRKLGVHSQVELIRELSPRSPADGLAR